MAEYSSITSSRSVSDAQHRSSLAAFRKSSLCRLAACIASLAGYAALTCGSLNADERPNIIVIFTDDQGYTDLGCQNIRDDVRTPHIDGLAESGIRMTNGFVTAPQCMPSRVGLLTGRYQQYAGVETNRTGIQPSKVASMLPNVDTIASYLQKAGYTTGMAGKWGVGGGPVRTQSGTQPPGQLGLPKRDLPLLPAARGFDEYLSGVSNVYVASHEPDGTPVDSAPKIITDKRYRVEVQADAALSFVNRHANDDQPFFLYYAPYSPHAPFEAPDSYLAKFAHVKDARRRVCLAMMACVDDSVGRIVDSLKEHEIDGNTLVWYISDNGAPTNGGGLNLPLGGAKGSLLDGGIRVPFIISWPGHLPVNTEYNQMVSTLDVLPTCLSVAGVNDVPERLDGVNLLPFLAGDQATAPHDFLFFRWTFQGSEQAAIRAADWKLIRSNANTRLFDLSSDVGEEHNVASAKADIAKNLETKLTGWLQTLPAAAAPPKARAQRKRR